MAALRGGAIGRFLKSPPSDVDAVLVYGPDAGLVRERAMALVVRVTPDLKDPFNAIEFTDQDLKAEPSRLADEAAALSFLGGRRSIRLRTSGDAAHDAAKLLVDALDGGYLNANALVVVEAGDLARTSRLRKLFEAARRAVTVPCYEDRAEDVAALAETIAREHGLRFARNALDYAASLLGSDRGVTRSELEKVALYHGPPSDDREADAVITLEDVHACLVDGESEALYEVAAAALDGDPARLSRGLRRLAASGGSDVGLTRALQREVARLMSVHDDIAAGRSPKEAMARLRPPVFFGDQRAFTARLNKWPPRKLAIASDALMEAEVAAKTTGWPAQLMVERTAFRLVAMAARAGQASGT